jgi:tyrosinase
MKKPVTRRRFIKSAGVAASVAFIVPAAFDLDTVVRAAPVLRRDIAGLTAASPTIVSYANAITAMKALPDTNPLSWGYQAAIHGTTASGSHTAWNSCEHGTLFFWSWHRMYLYWFERIIRKHSGDAAWGLPFWNYSASAAQRKIPPMFRDSSSVLFANRKTAMNNGTGSLLASAVNTGPGMAETVYEDANDTFEGTPHDDVHVGVGGLMGSVPTAARDPLFYLHHCNIDRLWNLWLAQGGGRHNPLSDTAWKNNQYTFFDENGAEVKMSGCQILRAAEQLNYTYEGEPTQVKSFCLPIFKRVFFVQKEVLFRLPDPPPVLRSDRVSFPIDVRQLRRRLTLLSASRTEIITLDIEGVEAERPPGVTYEVYVGLPPNVEPDSKSPYYVGNISLFSQGIRSTAHHGFKPASFSFRVNRALAAALKAGGDRLQVTIVPRDIEIDGKPTAPRSEADVRIGSAALAVKRQRRQ